MSLLIEKLHQVRRQGDKIIARCPACAETGHDAAGDHLVIYAQGHFACVVHPGSAGKVHRGRIFQLVGDNSPRAITVRPISRQPSGTPRLNILGRLGRVFCTRSEDVPLSPVFETELVLGVPNVPKLEFEEKLGRLGRVNSSYAYVHENTNIRSESVLPVPSVPKYKRGVRACYRSSPEDLTDAARLSDWLTTAPLPVSFTLSAWERVVQADLFRNRLLQDLTYHHTAMFAPALDRARRVYALFLERNTTHAN